MPCKQVLARLALLHFNEDSLHQAANCELYKTKPALFVIQTHQKPPSPFSFYKLYANTSFNEKRYQLHLSYLLWLLHQLASHNFKSTTPQDQLQLKTLLTEVMEKYGKYILLFPQPHPHPLPHLPKKW
jgi:hypothetical protein